MDSGESPSRREADAYLSSLSGDAAERVTAMKWARYLGAAFGTPGALSALRYYREINWISESVQRTMVDYVRGLPIEELEGEGDTSVSLDDSLDSLSDTHFERHAKSLEFIAAIAGNSIEHGLASLKITDELGAGGMGPATPGVTGEGVGGPFGRPVETHEPADRAARASGSPDVGTDEGSEARTGTQSTDGGSTESADITPERADETPSTDPASTVESGNGETVVENDGGVAVGDGTVQDDEDDPAQDDEDDAAGERRCIALTDSGDRCSRPAVEGDYCHQHAPE